MTEHTDTEPVSEGGFRYSDRAAILCRTCMEPITYEERTEPGYLPRQGWYDAARSDPIVCFKASGYRHVPLTDREWAYYEAGQKSVAARVDAARRDADSKAFIAGWFAHARNPERLVYRIGDLCPACMAKHCRCPVDDTAARAVLTALPVSDPTQPEAALHERHTP